MQIRVVPRGIGAVQAFLKELPRGSMRSALQAFGTYLLGDDNHGLRHMVPYSFVSRKSAYGVSFSSDKQRAWFFAALKRGEINPGSGNRTDTTRGWTMVTQNSGYSISLRTSTKAAWYTMGDSSQARQPARVGHRKVSEVIRTNMAGAYRAAIQAVNAWIKSRNG